ncbi:MAG: DUF5939 domain-containing protein [Candidatus Sericytochromatia bacterium]
MRPIETLREPSVLQKWREQCLTVSAELVLTQPPETLWPIVSNTDMLNAKMGLNPTENQFSPATGGGSQMYVETQAAGMKMAYEEFPFSWQAPVYFEVERVYHKGPLHYLRFEIRLAAEGTGTRLTVAIHFVPALPAVAIKGMMQLNLGKMVKVLEFFDQQLAAGIQGIKVFFDEHKKLLNQARDLEAGWQKLAPETPIPAALAHYVCCAPDRYAGRLRPFEAASLYDLNPLDTLRFCLLAAKAGYLHLRWDMRCPSCKGPKEQTAHLAGVATQAACPTCTVDYSVGFDQNLELTFWPDRAWRKVEETHFCAGGPANTAHLPFQHNLWPGQEATLTLALPPGAYFFRSLAVAGELAFEVAEGGLTELTLSLTDSFPETPLRLAPVVALRLHNPKPYFQTLQVENLDWDAQSCTGALVSSLQEFRELFSQELLGADTVLAVSQQTLMLACLTQTGAPAPDEEFLDVLRQAIHSADGAEVRAQGQQLLAAFQDPLDAVRAALRAQQHIRGLNTGLTAAAPLGLTLAIHEGPCEVGTADGRLDYRGEALEITHFLLALAQPGDLLIPAGLFEDPDLKWLLANQACRVTGLQLEVPESGGATVSLCRIRPGGDD